MSGRPRYVHLTLTENEWLELCSIIENGWADGDFAGWGGADTRVQVRAKDKVLDADLTTKRNP